MEKRVKMLKWEAWWQVRSMLGQFWDKPYRKKILKERGQWRTKVNRDTDEKRTIMERDIMMEWAAANNQWAQRRGKILKSTVSSANGPCVLGFHTNVSRGHNCQLIPLSKLTVSLAYSCIHVSMWKQWTKGSAPEYNSPRICRSCLGTIYFLN